MKPREGGARRALPRALGLLVVGLGAGLLWWSAAREGDAAQAPAAMPDVAAAPPPAPAPLPEDLPEPVVRYLEATPYPKSSGRLTERDADLLAPNRRHERFRPIPDTLSHDPAAVVSSRLTADRYFYESDQTVHARLDVTQGDRALGVRVIEAGVTREGRAGAEGAPEPVTFVSRGLAWALDLPLSRFADHHGSLVLTVTFEYAPSAFHEESLRLFVTPESRIPARFTGAFEERLVEGSLRIDTGIEVDEPGFYRIDANFFDARGRPVGFASFKGELSRGGAEVPLELYGKVLRDTAFTGSLTLRNLRGYRFREGEFPDRERMRDFEGEHVTREYQAADFTDEPHLSEHERHMVELMLEDVARGISIDVPPLPTGP